MIDAFNGIWDLTRPGFHQQRTQERARRLAISSLLCLGRHTVTGLIATGGCQHVDWSADYRVFEQGRFDPNLLFQSVRDTLLKQLPPRAPLVVLMDDTLFRKRGRHIDGTAWKRDPLGPAFHDNFIWGQRFLQVSAVLPEHEGISRARAIPIDWRHCPSPRKPARNATETEWSAYRQAQKARSLPQQGVESLQALRQAMDQDPAHRSRRLIASVDGSFTNRTVLKSLPPRTVLIGRIRKDAKLYTVPAEATPSRGRKRGYGDRVATPEEIRHDPAIPWISVSAFAAGKEHVFACKTLSPVRWRNAGSEHDLRVVAIRPLAYRLTKHSRLLYRKPVYLICTDPSLPLGQLLQDYIWRWEIEVNFRDEKTLLGMEQPQVRIPQAVTSVTTFLVVAYAILLLAGTQMEGGTKSLQPLTPKWRSPSDETRLSTMQMISLFRKQLWGLGIQQSNFSGFVHTNPSVTIRQKLQNSLHNAVFFAHG